MPARSEVELSEDRVVALSAELVEAKHEETSDHIKADALVGGAEFEEDDEVEEIHTAGETELAEDEEAEEDERREEAHPTPLKIRLPRRANSPRMKPRKSKSTAPPIAPNSKPTPRTKAPNTPQPSVILSTPCTTTLNASNPNTNTPKQK